VGVEDVDVVEVHAGQRLVERGENVLAPAAALAVGAGPHVPARLGRDHHLVAVGAEVFPHRPAEVDLGGTVGRPVVVGEVVVGDPEVEGAAGELPLRLGFLGGAGGVPKTEGEGRGGGA